MNKTNNIHHRTNIYKERIVAFSIKISLILLVIISIITFLGCQAILGTSGKNEKEYNVTLILLYDGKEVKSTNLIQRRSGLEIYEPQRYKAYPAFMSGYTVVGDTWSEQINGSNAFFPITMPDHDLQLYANVRPLTNLNNISLLSPEAVEAFFKGKTSLKDEYNLTPDRSNASSYYEISEYSFMNIENKFRYYPALKEVKLVRAYSESSNFANKMVLSEDYGIGLSINLEKHSFVCKGIYNRYGINATDLTITGYGTIEITYEIKSLAIDNIDEPLAPNVSLVEYSYQIANSSDYSAMIDLWNSDGAMYAQKCYNQLNTLLKTMQENIHVLMSSSNQPSNTNSPNATQGPSPKPTATPTKNPTATPTKALTPTPTKEPEPTDDSSTHEPYPDVMLIFNNDDIFFSSFSLGQQIEEIYFDGDKCCGCIDVLVGGDPFIILDFETLVASGEMNSISADDFKVLQIGLRVNTSEGSPNGSIYYQTSKYSGYSEPQNCFFSYAATDEPQIINIDFAKVKRWTGTVKNCRFDMFTSCRENTTLELYYLAFFTDITVAEAFAAKGLGAILGE